MRRSVAVVIAVVVAATACATESPRDDDQLRVVTTVSPITDIVRQVAGAEVEVHGLVPEGVNSHTFEPKPSDARTLAGADAFFANGLQLEEPSLELAEANLPDGAPVVQLADRTITGDEWVYDFSFPEEGGKPNPHLWLNPIHAARYGELVARTLAEIDPTNASAYRERAREFEAQLRELDRAIAAAWQTVPQGQRKLVTYHDSWAYFAPRYDVEVVAAVQPSDFSEPSLSDVRAIIEQVRAARVPAIFGSEVFPSDVLEQIADETGARYVDDLRDDDLPGEPGDPEHSYVGMMVANVRIMVEALGGDAAALDAVDPAA